MKKEIKKLNRLLKKQSFSKNERAGIIVYFLVVFFGKSIHKMAKFIEVPEENVVAGLAKISQKIVGDKEYHAKLHEVAKEYFMNELSKVVA